MSDADPPEDPFAGIPFIGELLKMMQGVGRPGTDSARQLARTIATEGQSEPNVDPADRIAVEQFDAGGRAPCRRHDRAARRAATVLSASRSATGPSGPTAPSRTIAPLFEALSSSMAAGLTMPDDLPADDPMASMMAGIGKIMGPMVLGMMTGSMVGHLAHRALGGLRAAGAPRPGGRPLLVLLRNIDEFGAEWSLNIDDLRLWVCLHEAAHEAVLAVPHVRTRLEDLLTPATPPDSSPDPAVLEQRLGGFDLAAGPEALAELQETLGDPDVILGAVRSPAQDALQPELTALVAAITGYVDHVMDEIGGNLIGSYPMLTEALRRRRVETAASNRFVERDSGSRARPRAVRAGGRDSYREWSREPAPKACTDCSPTKPTCRPPARSTHPVCGWRESTFPDTA